MNETLVTMIGNVASTVSYVQTAGGVPMANFRLAATERRYDRNRGDWVDGETHWVTVVAWRWLAANVVSSLGKGDPVVVSGRLRIREWDDGGKRRSAVEIDARVVGHDLGRGTSAFRWAVRGRPEAVGAAAGAVTAGGGASGAAGAGGGGVGVVDPWGVGPEGKADAGSGGWPGAVRGSGRFADEARPRQGALPVGEAVPEWIVAAVQARRAAEEARAGGPEAAQAVGAAGGPGGGGGAVGVDAGGGGGSASGVASAGPPGQLVAGARAVRPGRAARPSRPTAGRRSRSAGESQGAADEVGMSSDRAETEEVITV
ncbi:single-strand DNA-binding protein [Kitasatospora sp. MAA4]|uniref:single-stranded DNA-binding protein n=1 Tax=Kitasatospora sp. MAA4 TaxID=3035093 RepID=UPI002476E04F|nr:single-stranded DNA-binding protein [Kitasatospora sp. MAA4]MDH6135866.1 single-strand DNA-binding protein [Kitasatospora sp. MAA4]